MALFAEEVGTGPRLVAVHGFTQTRRSWSPIVERLADHYRWCLVDAPGHGRSASVRAGLWEGAALLREVGSDGAYLGYSMGARLCLHAALAGPPLVHRLVLVGVHPGLVDPIERRHRQDQDEALASRVELEGVAPFVDWWLRQPLFATLDPSAAGREERLGNTAAGLAASLRLEGTGSQEPLWDRLSALSMPVLLVAGEHDTKFRDLASQAAAAIGANATVAWIPGAGHACHLERPDAFAATLSEFLTS